MRNIIIEPFASDDLAQSIAFYDRGQYGMGLEFVAEVKDMLSGHTCRCTGYLGIVNAILEVSGAATRKTEGGSI